MKNKAYPALCLHAGVSGFTLLACLVLSMALLMMTLAALRFAHDFRFLVTANVDRLIAKEAAEAALQDAYHHLEISDDPLSVAANDIVYKFGSVTGSGFSYGGRMQSIASPEYQLAVLHLHEQEGISRVTATGFGMVVSTRAVIQADYVIRLCSDDVTIFCQRKISELAWREQVHE